jgi:hypothetical protein
VIYSPVENDWRVQAVPIAPGQFGSKVPLHPDWRGISNEKLAEISGLQDIQFCHASGFIGGSKSYDTALKMAELTLAHAETAEPPLTKKRVQLNGDTVTIDLTTKQLQLTMTEATDLASLLPEIKF